MSSSQNSTVFRTFLVLVFLMSAFAVQTPAQTVTGILKKMDKQYRKLSTLRADITMGRYDPILQEWNTYKGTILLIAGRDPIKNVSLRIDWTAPRKETLSVVNGKYIVYNPAVNVAYTGLANIEAIQNKTGALFSFLTMSKTQLIQNYSATYLGREKIEKKIRAWHLRFTPKTASIYKNADIWVDKKGMILQVKIVLKSGDEMSFKLSKVEKNIKLDPKQFILNLHNSVRMIRG